LSVAVGVGFIALAGVAVEIGVVMLVYLNQAIRRISAATREDVERAVIEGALLRIRPVIMTVAATIGGLLPIMFGSGTGSEVMRRIAAPMVGGMGWWHGQRDDIDACRDSGVVPALATTTDLGVTPEADLPVIRPAVRRANTGCSNRGHQPANDLVV
jgi:hypothetical protein